MIVGWRFATCPAQPCLPFRRLLVFWGRALFLGGSELSEGAWRVLWSSQNVQLCFFSSLGYSYIML